MTQPFLSHPIASRELTIISSRSAVRVAMTRSNLGCTEASPGRSLELGEVGRHRSECSEENIHSRTRWPPTRGPAGAEGDSRAARHVLTHGGCAPSEHLPLALCRIISRLVTDWSKRTTLRVFSYPASSSDSNHCLSAIVSQSDLFCEHHCIGGRQVSASVCRCRGTLIALSVSQTQALSPADEQAQMST
jgi:hypothetical protein